MTTNTDKAEWLGRCAQRYLDKSKIDEEAAREFALGCWELRLDDDESPEDAADEDISYWEAE